MTWYSVVGESHKNTDGTERQKIIAQQCVVGAYVKLIREPRNPYDKNAVAIHTSDGNQIGYLSRDDAVAIAKRLDKAESYDAWVSRRRGGTKTKPSYGVVINVWFAGDRSTAEKERARDLRTAAEEDELVREAEGTRDSLLSRLGQMLRGRGG